MLKLKQASTYFPTRIFAPFNGCKQRAHPSFHLREQSSNENKHNINEYETVYILVDILSSYNYN